MASMAYHFGCNNSPHNLDEYIPAAKKRVECYAKAAPYLKPPAVRHEVPFENFRMASYLRVPSGITKPPVVMIISGLESTKEEARTMEDGFLRRGMATFTFDGPGQGESWFQGGLIVEFERATSAVIDYLEKFPAVDAEPDRRLRAEHGRLSRAAIGRLRCAHQSVRVRRRHVRPHSRAQSSRRSLRIRARRAHLEGLRQAEAGRTAQPLHARRLASKIRCPLLVVHGDKDFVPVEQAKRIYDEASGPKEWLLLEGGNHVCNNMPFRYRPVGDFLAKHLGAKSV